MIQEDLAKQVLKKLSGFDIFHHINNKNYYFKDTLKQCLLDNINSGGSTVIIESSNELKIQISKDEFKTALFSDFYFGHIRIKEQCNNLNNLINSGSQVSWVITTAYYACYFMAVEIAKLYGEFIVNFSKGELTKILCNSENINNLSIIPEGNNSFKVFVKLPEYDGGNFLDLQMMKEGSKPHQIVWINLYKIINKLKVNDSLLPHKNLLLAICDSNKNRWKLPSTIRNEWNYTYANYYASRGSELGKSFLSIIKNSESAMRWGNLRTLHPTEENITASIAYLYHCLSETIININSKFGQ